jgi:hypothetical protein
LISISAFLIFWAASPAVKFRIYNCWEQTLSFAKSQNLLEETEHGWCYRGDEQVLIYDLESEQLSIAANDGSWKLTWHEGLFVQSVETQITDEHLAEFHELGNWLETQNDSQPFATDLPQAEMLLSHAAQLFEYYASQEDLAFKFSPDSTEHFYRVQIENEIYLISRADESELYSLQREDGTALSTTDVQAWKQMGTWLQKLADQPPQQVAHVAAPYWEQQTIQANSVLLDAQAAFTFYEQTGNIEYDAPRQSYIATIAEYTLGYHSSSDLFWLEKNGERFVSATHYQQHRDGSQWHLTELHDLGNIVQEDVRRLREWSAWLTLQDESEPERSQQVTHDLLEEEPQYFKQKSSDYDRDR